MIYFIESVGDDLVKIGFTSRDIRFRLSDLQVGSSRPLKVLKTILGGREEERRVHLKFSGHRVTGEWFRLTPIRKDIDRIYDFEVPPKVQINKQPLSRPVMVASEAPNRPSPTNNVEAWFFHITDGAWGRPPFTA